MDASVLISAAMVALNGLIPPAAELKNLEWGFKGDLTELHRNLKNIHDGLRDAENRMTQLEAAEIERLQKDLRPVICSAENVVDELRYEDVRRKIEVDNRMRNKVRHFFSLSNPLAFRLKVVHKLKHVNLKLREICPLAHGIGLRPADNLINEDDVVQPGKLKPRYPTNHPIQTPPPPLSPPMASEGNHTIYGEEDLVGDNDESEDDDVVLEEDDKSEDEDGDEIEEIEDGDEIEDDDVLEEVVVDTSSSPFAAQVTMAVPEVPKPTPTHRSTGSLSPNPTRQCTEDMSAASAVIEEKKPLASLDYSKVVGRHRDVSIVRDMLLGIGPQKDDNDMLLGIGPEKDDVVAIVGMAGVGKATLAQLVFRDEDVVKHFGCHRMWVCVSNDFNVKRLLNEMMESLSGGKSEATDIDEILRNLGQNLNGERFLLVLQDVWNDIPDKWECMRNCLLKIGGSKGSKVLVTTCTKAVVSTMQTSPSLTHHLDPLLGDHSWSLFRKWAFANGGPRETHTLVEIGRRIVEKCKGLPLLIKEVASLLNSNQDENEWRSIENNETLASFINETRFLQFLRMSFDRLPSPSLKRCFAYCSIFPKGSVIRKDELIQLWMNLGYLHPPLGSNLEMEDVGNDYFDILLGNFFFHDVEMDEYKNITSSKMQDHVHDFAVHVSKGHCLTMEPSERKSHPEVQHLSSDIWEETSLEFRKANVGKLTALLPKMVANINCTLALRFFGNDVDELPSSIRKLIRLRYLDLSETSIRKIPNFITKLYNLQTLKLPRDLLELPKDFHKLVSLRHLCMAYTIKTRKLMLMNIGKLTCLQTLPFFVVGKGCSPGIEELGSLSKLRGRFHVYSLQHVKDTEEAKKAKISEKSGIQELGFHWDQAKVGVDSNTENQLDVLEELQPHGNIRGLILENFGGSRFPSWMMNVDPPLLLNLVKIELRNCSQCEQVPSLGHLPHLEIIEMVRLENLEHIDPESCHYNDGRALEEVAFPALRRLTLDGMPKLGGWSSLIGLSTHRTVFFPRLEELNISGCPQLIDIPDNLFTIQELTVSSINLSNAESGSRCHPCMTIFSKDWDSEMDGHIEYLLEKSSNSLRNLTIRGFNELHCFPNKLWNLVSLEKLEIIECSNLKYDTNGIEGFNCLESLVNLTVRGCPGLVSCWEEQLFSPMSLQRLEIGNFSNQLQAFPLVFTSAAASAANANNGVDILHCLQCGADFQHCLQCGNSLSLPSTSTSIAAAKQPQQFSFMSLRSLHLWGWEKLAHLPEGLQHLTTLRELSIHSFHLLLALPDWLANISSLQSLAVYNCINLMSFPRLAFLLYLTIVNCPLLMKRCERRVGPEWKKIAHIPSVKFSFSVQE